MGGKWVTQVEAWRAGADKEGGLGDLGAVGPSLHRQRPLPPPRRCARRGRACQKALTEGVRRAVTSGVARFRGFRRGIGSMGRGWRLCARARAVYGQPLGERALKNFVPSLLYFLSIPRGAQYRPEEDTPERIGGEEWRALSMRLGGSAPVIGAAAVPLPTTTPFIVLAILRRSGGKQSVRAPGIPPGRGGPLNLLWSPPPARRGCHSTGEGGAAERCWSGSPSPLSEQFRSRRGAFRRGKWKRGAESSTALEP